MWGGGPASTEGREEHPSQTRGCLQNANDPLAAASGRQPPSSRRRKWEQQFLPEPPSLETSNKRKENWQALLHAYPSELIQPPNCADDLTIGSCALQTHTLNPRESHLARSFGTWGDDHNWLSVTWCGERTGSLCHGCLQGEDRESTARAVGTLSFFIFTFMTLGIIFSLFNSVLPLFYYGWARTSLTELTLLCISCG